MKTLELTEEELKVLKVVMESTADSVHHCPECIGGDLEPEDLDERLKTFAVLEGKIDKL